MDLFHLRFFYRNSNSMEVLIFSQLDSTKAIPTKYYTWHIKIICCDMLTRNWMRVKQNFPQFQFWWTNRLANESQALFYFLRSVSIESPLFFQDHITGNTLLTSWLGLPKYKILLVLSLHGNGHCRSANEENLKYMSTTWVYGILRTHHATTRKQKIAVCIITSYTVQSPQNISHKAPNNVSQSIAQIHCVIFSVFHMRLHVSIISIVTS